MSSRCSDWFVMLLIGVLALGLPAPSSRAADDAAAASAPAQQAEQPPKYPLWKATSGENTVYLFGTIHLGKPAWYPLAPHAKTAFDASDRLVTEVDMTPKGMMDASRVLMSKAGYPAGDSLKQAIERQGKPELVKKLRDKLKTMGLPAEQFMQFRPFFLSMQISVLKMIQLGYNPQYGVEMQLMDMAKNRNFLAKQDDAPEGAPQAVKLGALETPEEQATLLSGLPEAVDIRMLEQTIDDLDEIDEMMRKMSTAWIHGDTKLITDVVLKPLREDPDMKPAYQGLILKRNKLMAKRIQAMLKKHPGETLFVAVGFGHLVGPKSVNAYLKKAGFEVTRVLPDKK